MGRDAGDAGDHVDTVDEDHRPHADTNVALVGNQRNEAADESERIGFRWILAHQHEILATVPAPRPAFIGPADAEREIRFARLQHVPERPLGRRLPPANQ